jgi:RNA polymerase sigma-70 factor (ECF subfamily)
MQTPTGQITELLAGWREGNRDAFDRLLPLIQTELQRLARRHLGRERRRHGMQPSSLVQEAFLRLLPGAAAGWSDRAHFLAAASQVMRHVLVDYAREKRRVKRGADAVHVPFDEAVVLTPDQVEEIVVIDLALQRLAQADERKSRVFEMRFFGGLSVEEAAEVLQIAPNTVIRDWSFARAWLRRELRGTGADDCGTLAAS